MSERDFDFGSLQATVKAQGDAIQALTTSINESNKQIEAIRLQMAEAKGGWRAIMFVAGISGTLGAIAGKVGPLLLKTPV